jgi:zinc finger protein
MELGWEAQEIPHFGEAMLITGVCSCGFRHCDTMLLEQREPCRYTLEVEGPDDLDSRVIRSSSGTIRVPELGVKIEPGPASEAYISNVEGVLERIVEIVEFATRSAQQAGDLERTRRGEEVLDQATLARKGQLKLTFVLEDPLGNSVIASERAVRSTLTEEEIADLQTGMVLLSI